MFFDPLYLLFIAPAAILAAWAQWKVTSSFQAASRVTPASGVSGAEAAAVILRQAGIDAQIEPAGGFLSDHYDPRQKVLRLSPDVLNGRSLAAVGVAAHEAGHALQDATGYPLLAMRNAIVPLAAFGGNVSWILLLLGFLMASLNLVLLGIAAFSLTVIFQLINLPVEFNASARAKELLVKLGIVRGEEEQAQVRRVLSAAAMTYVAATLMSLLQLAYFLTLAGRGRDDR